jgi:hypothetical protein
VQLLLGQFWISAARQLWSVLTVERNILVFLAFSNADFALEVNDISNLLLSVIKQFSKSM